MALLDLQTLERPAGAGIIFPSEISVDFCSFNSIFYCVP
jgi:hypothetical protein